MGKMLVNFGRIWNCSVQHIPTRQNKMKQHKKQQSSDKITIQMRLSYQQLFSALPLTGELVNPADCYSWNPLCILLFFFVHCFLLSPRSIVLSHLRALCFLIYLQQIAPFLCNPSTVCWKFSTLVNKSSQIAEDTLSKGLLQNYCGFRSSQSQLHRPKEE